MTAGFPYGKMESRHKDRQMETTGSALLLLQGAQWMWLLCWLMDLPLSSCPLPYLGFGAAREGTVGSPNQTFPSRLLPPIGPRQRGENGGNSCWLHSSSRLASHSHGPQGKSHHPCSHDQEVSKNEKPRGLSRVAFLLCVHMGNGGHKGLTPFCFLDA